MKAPSAGERDALWAHHHAEWRDPAAIAGLWRDSAEVDPRLLRSVARGRWWEALAACGATLLVTREYEHLAVALGVDEGGREGGRRVSMLPIPHPSGIAVDAARGVVHVASTRNPNQILDLMPATGLARPAGSGIEPLDGRPLVPVRSRFLPGSLYLHDLALVGGALHANAVGQNAVVRLHDDGRVERAWWPRCIETRRGPLFAENRIQLNSIAAGRDLASSCFTASADRLARARPGAPDFPVDKRGVLFSGASRERVAGGLTRPHSARWHEGRVWLANSGYGEVGFVEEGAFVPVARLPGWTRGLGFHGGIAFAGTSRVIPRFRGYAPGLDVDASECAVHAIDATTGRVLGSLVWPHGNQIFAVECVSSRFATGFPFSAMGRRGAGRAARREKSLFYAFETSLTTGEDP